MQHIDLDGSAILVTGAAGFIGANLCEQLLLRHPGAEVIGLDNMSDYYDVALKEDRLERLRALDADGRFTFVRGSIADKALVDGLFDRHRFDVVVNLAAQAGVRYSIDHPDVYIESNIIGFYNILEACRHSYDGGAKGVAHLVYASSSSVYGGNKKVPFSTDDRVDHPVSLYAATKKSDELLAHAYAKLYDIPTTGLRFFTVYGPAGRPDMFYFSATQKLVKGETIRIFNYGNCKRDFTYIDDIVEGVLRVMAGAPSRQTGEDGLPVPPCAVYNIGGGTPVDLLDFVDALQEALVRFGVLHRDFDFEAHKALVPMQPGDVPVTYADTDALARDYGFTPRIGVREGLSRFAEWYAKYYR
ncbi:MAG: GDP-mannose 4,6-dehydratase [Clostridia bacterium]|nr:GDP-mannose 4,6-dehydratase [Clostridia bacterium]